METPHTPRLRFGRDLRVRRRAEFDAILGQNRSRSDERMVVFLAERRESGRESPPSRLGLIVGRKAGNAVIRNRIKRRTREAFRLLQHDLPAGLDIVVMPRPPVAATLAVPDIQQSLRRLVRRPLPEPRPRDRTRGRGRGKGGGARRTPASPAEGGGRSTI